MYGYIARWHAYQMALRVQHQTPVPIVNATSALALDGQKISRMWQIQRCVEFFILKLTTKRVVLFTTPTQICFFCRRMYFIWLWRGIKLFQNRSPPAATGKTSQHCRCYNRALSLVLCLLPSLLLQSTLFFRPSGPFQTSLKAWLSALIQP